MTSKVNIEQLEGYLKQAGVENGELEKILKPIKELNNQRRYGLVWEEPDNNTYGTDSAEQELLRNFPFLKEVNEHRIFNGEDNPDHLLIEGDNLHALKTMQYTHKNKIDVIYIDPPYNTGNTDFVYNDKYVDNEDSWRHSKWLSFMNKRLRLARELMTDEGVIFISIDDNELYQLKLLCDQVFGENNFVNNFMWLHGKGKKTHQSRTLQQYNLCYVKNIRKQGEWVEYKELNYKFSNPDNDPKGDWFSGSVSFSEKRSNPNSEKFYEVESPSGIKWNRQWMVTKEEMEKLIDSGDIYFGDHPTFNKVPRLKIRRGKDKVIPNNIIKDVGTTKSATTELDNMLGEGKFDYPKPVGLVKHLISIVTDNKKDVTVLDFFAGSGTTAHAVMELNEEDGGNRQAIVITNNEINDAEEENLLVEKGYVEPFTGTRRGTKKHSEWLEKVNEFKQTPEYLEFIKTDEYKDLGIARAVTEQRINKVINGYTTPNNKEVEGLDNNNFYHFEVVLEPDLLDMDLNTYVLVNKTKDIIRMKEDVYADEVDISTDNTPAIKLVNDEKEVIVVQSVRVIEEGIHELVQNFNDEGKEHIIYTSYGDYEYNLHNIIYKELPKELLQAIKHNEGE